MLRKGGKRKSQINKTRGLTESKGRDVAIHAIWLHRLSGRRARYARRLVGKPKEMKGRGGKCGTEASADKSSHPWKEGGRRRNVTE